jgi:hypothetical protein
MIVIDGRESSISLSNFTNLEEVLIKIIEEEGLEERIVTDVLLDDEAFSELYPRQAEDIEAESFSRLELRTVSIDQMADDVIEELPKVIDIMARGSRQAAALLRQAELAEGLEVLQDIVGVSRELLNTVDVLRAQYSTGSSKEIIELGDTLSELLSEICDVMTNEDWVLVADLMEYEYLPACEAWRPVIDAIRNDREATKAA